MTRGEARGSGVLVISVWHEPDGGDGFRARIIFGGEDPAAESDFLLVRDRAKVIEAVERWLGTVGH